MKYSILSLTLVALMITTCGKDKPHPPQLRTLPLSNMNWACYTLNSNGYTYVNPAPTLFEADSEGLKIYGTSYRAGTYIHPTPFSQYPVVNKTLYFKWKANGGGGFMGVWPLIYTDSVLFTTPYYPQNLTTHHSYLDSYVITEDLWYYTRWVIGSTTYTCTTASGNYDNAGGTIVQKKTAALDHDYRCLGFGIFDCYNSTAAYAIIGEVRIE
jgi:hypothetical protein